jgi:hypothetical protein
MNSRGVISQSSFEMVNGPFDEFGEPLVNNVNFSGNMNVQQY